jgi:ribosomal protein L34E
MNPAQDALKSVLLKLNELLQLSIDNSSGAEQKVSTAVVQLISMVTTASHAVRTHHQEQADIQQKLAGCVTELEKISRAQGKELKRLSSKSFQSVACNTETIYCSGCVSKEATIKLCNEQLSIARDSVTDLTHKLRVSKTLLLAQQVSWCVD